MAIFYFYGGLTLIAGVLTLIALHPLTIIAFLIGAYLIYTGYLINKKRKLGYWLALATVFLMTVGIIVNIAMGRSVLPALGYVLMLLAVIRLHEHRDELT